MERGDVLLTREAPMGEVGYVDFDDTVFLGQRIMQYRTNPNMLNARYLLYAFLSPDLQNQFKMHDGSGSVVSHIRVPDCSKFELNLPPLWEQEAIVSILGELDDKIQLNHQLNQTLEQLAQAIFKSWFVDFEPIKAKIAARKHWLAMQPANESASPVCFASDAEYRPPGDETPAVDLETAMTLAAMRAISGRFLTDAGTDPLARLQTEQPEQFAELRATAALFPAAMQESELGEVPEGWEVKILSDFGSVVTGKTPPKKESEAYGEGVSFVTPTDITNDVYVTRTARQLTDIGIGTVKKSFLPKGSICVSCIGSQMGRTIITPYDAITNQQINSIIVDQSFLRYYLFLNLRQRRSEIFSIGSSGSTMPIINKTTFSKLSILSPQAELLIHFDQVVEKSFERILCGLIESETLSNLRDTLLPKLLSGELTLPEGEELCSQVAV